MAEYTVIGLVYATTYEQIEADGPVDAAERAELAVSVCHQCAQGLEVGEVYAVRVLGEDGDIVYTDERDDGLARQLADVERERDELLVRVAELEASDDWQPIETAPRDGTRILVYFPAESQWGEDGGVRSAQWDDVVCAWDVDALGAVEDCYGALLGPSEVGGPSHWRPMPGGPGDE